MRRTPKAEASGRRSLENYTNLGRKPIESHLRRFMDNLPEDALPSGEDRPSLDAFDESALWNWLTTTARAVFRTEVASLFLPSDRRHPYPVYPVTGEQGRYDLSGMAAKDGTIRIALAGDWGTGTDVSQQVADAMVAEDPKPQLTIHLGDIYYVGAGHEVAETCFGQTSPTGNYQGVFWRKGTHGSFALCGNHEMYSGGDGYFDELLPKMGIPSSQDGAQLASYFCLETPGWRILGLDTGYNSDTLFGHAKLEPTLLEWLDRVVEPVKHRKPTVVLSHHQWFSAFGDGAYTGPANQLASYLQRQEFVWLWGHEHRLAIYDKFRSPENGMCVYGRCVGHGGMPVALPEPKYPVKDGEQTVEFWDGAIEAHPKRFRTLRDGTKVSPNGFVQMTIDEEKLTLEYRDADRTLVLTESFVPGGGAVWDGTLVRTVECNPGILAS